MASWANPPRDRPKNPGHVAVRLGVFGWDGAREKARFGWFEGASPKEGRMGNAVLGVPFGLPSRGFTPQLGEWKVQLGSR